MSDDVKKIAKALSARTERPTTPLRDEDRLSLGTTVLNVSVSRGRWTDGGVCKGQIIWYVGESESGKTFAGVQLLAAACANPEFADYDLIYVDAENGLEIDIETFYGARLAARIDVARIGFVEDFIKFLYKRIKSGRKVVCVVDSMDALDTKPDHKKFEAANDAKPDDAVAGSYGTSKAKINKAGLGRLVPLIEQSGSVLMVISQVYDAIGTRFPMKVTAGGNALRFFAHVQLWTKVVGKLTKEVGGENWEKGCVVEVAIRKNRVGGWHGKAHVTFLSGYGFDDLGSSVDFLVKYGTWELKKGGVLDTKGFPVAGKRETVIGKIDESRKLRSQLAELVRKTFKRVDDSVTVKRKPRWQ